MSVGVQLSPSPVTGITARVVLPAAVLAMPGQLDAVPAAAQVSAEVRAAEVPAAGTRPAQVLAPPIPPPAAPPAPVPSPRAPQPVATHLAIGGRQAPVVEYITVPDVVRPDLGIQRPTTQLPTVPAAVPPPAPVPNGSDASTDRTRNGLLKRPPRRPGASVSPSIVERPERPAALDESPEQMRDRLVSLRAGVRRGETQRGVEGERGTRDR